MRQKMLFVIESFIQETRSEMLIHPVTNQIFMSEFKQIKKI